jgi:hypothetical protein
MAARLTSTGVTFGDGTSLNSKYGIVPQLAVSIFYQSGAPTGWTKLDSHNDKTLRVVSGTGGGSGPSDGGTAFTSVFPNSTVPISLSGSVTGTVENHTLTAPQLPVHSHGNGGSIGLSFTNTGDVGSGPGWTRSFPGTGGIAPASVGGGSHNHPFSASSSFSTSLDLRVQYIDVIICRFD